MRARDLYALYRAWCERSGERWTTQVHFGRLLTERGVGSARSNGVTWRTGIGLLDDTPPA